MLLESEEPTSDPAFGAAPGLGSSEMESLRWVELGLVHMTPGIASAPDQLHDDQNCSALVAAS